jgi:hypothetical protein
LGKCIFDFCEISQDIGPWDFTPRVFDAADSERCQFSMSFLETAPPRPFALPPLWDTLLAEFFSEFAHFHRCGTLLSGLTIPNPMQNILFLYLGEKAVRTG